MRCRLWPLLGLVLCTTLGFGLPVTPQRSSGVANTRNIPIILCSEDECADAQEKLAERCQENHFPAGQRVPNFLPEGVVCLCTCPEIDP